MQELRAQVAGIGLIGPGLAGWPAAAAVLSGGVPYEVSPTVIPPLAVLPPAERRRTGQTVRLALAAGLEAVGDAGVEAATLPAVFASSGGDGLTCHEICLTLAGGDRALSPTRFHNSVHNAPAGYWGIATGAQTPANVLCAYDGTFAAGLLEALAQVVLEARPVLLVAYDTAYVEPLASVRSIPDAFAVALVLAPPGSTGPCIRAQLSACPADRLPDPALERLRAAVPAARSLPLLSHLARRACGEVVLDYLEEPRLKLIVE